MLIEGDWCSGSADFNQLAADLNILTRDQTLLEFLDGQTPSGSTPLLIATARRMLAFSGDFTPVLAKLEVVLADRLHLDGRGPDAENFEPVRKEVEAWQRSELTDVTAKVVIYEAFVEDRLEAPRHLVRTVHDLYFEPKYEEFRPRRSAVCQMPSLRRSRNWSRFPTVRSINKATLWIPC